VREHRFAAQVADGVDVRMLVWQRLSILIAAPFMSSPALPGSALRARLPTATST
jgi:hypothetical protein